MTVPETPVDEDDCPVFRKHEIGFSGQVAAVEPKPEAFTMQRRSDYQLRFCIFALYPCHHPAADFGRDSVGRHGSAGDGRLGEQEFSLTHR